MARTPELTDSVVEQIAARINEGTYPAGGWLPKAVALGTEFGIHRRTVDRVLDRLQERGLVVRHPHKGATVVKRHGMIVITAADILEGAGDWRGFPASVYRAGGLPFNDITSAGDVPAPPEVARQLGVPEGTTVYERTRIQGEVEHGKRRPAQVSWSWSTMELVARVPAIRATPTTGPSPVRARVEDAGYRLSYAGRAKARHATPVERELLELAGDTAVVFDIWRTCFDQEGRPVETSRLIDDAEQVELAYSYTPAVIAT